MNSVPAQVQARADEADKKLQELSGKEKAPVTDLTVKPEYQDTKLPLEGETVEGLKKKLADTEHKLSVLQGKYNSEVQALKDDVNLLTNLKSQVRHLNGQIQEANVLIAGLQKELAAKKEIPAPVIDDAIPVLSDEDRVYLEGEGFDAKTIDVLSRMVKALAQKGHQAQPVPPKEEDIVAEVKRQVAQENAVAVFWKELAEKVPDWREINGDEDKGIERMPAFAEWIKVLIPYSNKTRGMAMAEAQERLDYVTVIQMFNDFKNPDGGVPEQKTGKEDKKIFDPEKHIEPRSSVAHQEDGKDAVKDKKVWPLSEITAFYSQVTKEKGRSYKGSEEDMKRIDAEILQAQKEGRIDRTK